MSVLEAIILGLVQGFTEFLPVSSSGHTIIAGKLLGLSEVPLAFGLIVHLATLIAVCIALRKRLFAIVKKPLGKDMRLILAATVPTVIIVFAFENIFRSAFSGDYLIYCFLITAILIIIAGMKSPVKMIKPQVTYFDAVLIGAAQGLAAFPGISRSGATICTASLLGNKKENSADFSFLISIPIIIGSSIMELIKNDSAAGIGALAVICGFFAAFISGLLSVYLLMRILKKYSLDAFAVYLFLLSIFLILNDLVLHIF